MGLIGNLMDGVLCLDRSGQITLINPAAEDLLGVNALVALGRPFGQLRGHPELVEPLERDHEQLAKQPETTRTIEVHHLEQDLIYIKAVSRPLRDAHGEPAGVITTLHDVTAEYKSNQLKNQYLSIVAHELRTPLTGIKTFSTMLSNLRLGPLSDTQREAVQAIREQSLRLEQQIDKLINLGYLDSNDYGQDLEALDLGELVALAVSPFLGVATERGLALRVEARQGVLVRADRDDLRRAMQALVENALKFSPENATVDVRVEEADESVSVSIRDEGIGIDPRYQRRIFERFFQVEDPLTRHHGGAGLGLFVADRILVAHGAKIEVRSELGAGAEFSFRLPKYEKSERPDEAITSNSA